MAVKKLLKIRAGWLSAQVLGAACPRSSHSAWGAQQHCQSVQCEHYMHCQHISSLSLRAFYWRPAERDLTSLKPKTLNPKADTACKFEVLRTSAPVHAPASPIIPKTSSSSPICNHSKLDHPSASRAAQHCTGSLQYAGAPPTAQRRLPCPMLSGDLSVDHSAACVTGGGSSRKLQVLCRVAAAGVEWAAYHQPSCRR